MYIYSIIIILPLYADSGRFPPGLPNNTVILLYCFRFTPPRLHKYSLFVQKNGPLGEWRSQVKSARFQIATFAAILLSISNHPRSNPTDQADPGPLSSHHPTLGGPAQAPSPPRTPPAKKFVARIFVTPNAADRDGQRHFSRRAMALFAMRIPKQSVAQRAEQKEPKNR